MKCETNSGSWPEEHVLPHLMLDRSSLVSDSPLRIALGWRLHPQGAVRGLVIVVFDPPQELTRDVFHRLETRLIEIVPLEAAKERLRQTVLLQTPSGRVARYESPGSHERPEAIRGVLPAIVAEKFDSSCVGPHSPKPVPHSLP